MNGSSFPGRWATMPLKAAARVNPEVLSEGTDPAWLMQYADIGGVSYELGMHTVEEVAFGEAPSRARRTVRDGDTIFSTVRTYLKAIAAIERPPENLIVSTGFAVLRPRPWAYPRFLSYVLQSASFIDQVVAHSEGVGYPAITPGVLASLPVHLPRSLEVQKGIADEIDALLGPLDETRASLRAAQGLAHERSLAIAANAIAELARDSPLVELRRVLRDVEQGWSPEAEDRPADEGEWAVLRLSAVKRGVFRPDEHKALPAGLEPRPAIEVRDGDLLVTRANTLDTVADACVVRAPPPRLMMSDLIFRLTPIPARADPDYLCLWLLSRHARQQIEADARGTSLSMVKVSQELLRRWLVPLPSLDAQREVVARVRVAQASARGVVDDARAAIALLAERRAALIQAAVSGRLTTRDGTSARILEAA